jgi:dehydrogenase/reductase SDR family member 12
MIKALGSAFFYAKFFSRFSALGFRRSAAGWTAANSDLSQQTWLVTGATGGIGRAIVLGALKRGAQVMAVGRSPEKLRALQRDAGTDRLTIHAVDLSLVAAVSAFAKQIARGPQIDVLVNNVGVLLNTFSTTPEGLETSFATNLLNHFVLTESLKASDSLQADGVVINVSSGGMYGMRLKLDEMNASDAAHYDGMGAYAMHKRAQVELTRAWNARWKSGPECYVMHPGWVDTDGVQSSLPLFRATLKRFLRDADQGADTVLWLAGARPPLAADGGIWLDRALQPEHEFAFTRHASPSADDLYAWLQQQRTALALG